MLNLDTHILIHALMGELTAKEHKLLLNKSWSISAIVLWEISKLSELGRITLDLDDYSVIRVLSGIQVWPITIDICRAIKKLDFDSDPADEIIAATSLVHNIPIVTRDKLLLKSKKLRLLPH